MDGIILVLRIGDKYYRRTSKGIVECKLDIRSVEEGDLIHQADSETVRIFDQKLMAVLEMSRNGDGKIPRIRWHPEEGIKTSDCALIEL